MPGHIHNQIFLSVDLKTALTMCQKATKWTKAFRENNNRYPYFCSVKINLITNRLVFKFGHEAGLEMHQVEINLRPHEGGTLVCFVDTSYGIDYTSNCIDEFINDFIESLGN